MTRNHIRIYYAKLDNQLTEHIYYDYLNRLPIFIQEKNVKYRRWQDRHLNLFGKLLLLEGLKNIGYASDTLNRINYSQYSRPFINGDVDFNISHSGNYVICAIGKNIRLGVDIEEIKEIDFDDFKKIMTKEQWQNILQSKDSVRSFFKYWTFKESVIKADSRGLSIPLLNIHVNNKEVFYEDKTWYLKNLNFNNQYCATLATNKRNITVDLSYIDFYK